MMRKTTIKMLGFIINASLISPLSSKLNALVMPHPGHGMPNRSFVGHTKMLTLKNLLTQV